MGYCRRETHRRIRIDYAAARIDIFAKNYFGYFFLPFITNDTKAGVGAGLVANCDIGIETLERIVRAPNFIGG